MSNLISQFLLLHSLDGVFALRKNQGLMLTYLARILQGQHQHQSVRQQDCHLKRYQNRQGGQPNVLLRYIMTSHLRTVFLRLFLCNFVNS